MTIPTSPWYATFFVQDYPRVYADVLATRRSDQEAAFVERVLRLSPGDRVLDLCCGWGRHAVLFAKHGLRVAALDLSAEYLELAGRAARSEGVDLEFVRGDMREIPFESAFDGIVNMFSSFGYLESDEEDVKVLRQVAKALKPDGRLLVDLINREWVVSNYIQNEWHSDEDGTFYLEHRELDLVSSRNHVTFTIAAPGGARSDSVGIHVRLYTLTEIIAMLERGGLTFTGVYGGYDEEEYSVSTRRMIVVGRKAG